MFNLHNPEPRLYISVHITVICSPFRRLRSFIQGISNTIRKGKQMEISITPSSRYSAEDLDAVSVHSAAPTYGD